MKALRLFVLAAVVAAALLPTCSAQAAPGTASFSWLTDQVSLTSAVSWLERLFFNKEGGYIDPDGAKGGSLIDPVGAKGGSLIDPVGVPRVVRNWGSEGALAKAGPDIMPDGNKTGPGLIPDGNP